MSSYDHFCFLQHIRYSAYPYVNSSVVLPSTEGSLRDALAETCYLYAQNLPTIVMTLPRAGLVLALLLSFFNSENIPGGLSLSSEDTTSGSTTTQTVTLALAMSEVPSQAQTRARTPAGVPIPFSHSPPSPSLPHPPGDLSTAPTSFVTARPTIVSRTTGSGDDGRTLEMRNDTEHYAPPHARGFVPH